jgi:hypothetical protein
MYTVFYTMTALVAAIARRVCTPSRGAVPAMPVCLVYSLTISQMEDLWKVFHAPATKAANRPALRAVRFLQ